MAPARSPLARPRETRAKDKFTADLIAACPELGLVRDLAEADKHHGLGRPSVTLEGLEGSQGGGILESFGPLGMTSSVDWGSLEIVEADGSRHGPLTAFRCVVEFWRSEVTRQASCSCSALPAIIGLSATMAAELGFPIGGQAKFHSTHSSLTWKPLSTRSDSNALRSSECTAAPQCRSLMR
jgi:hypothetical protein